MAFGIGRAVLAVLLIGAGLCAARETFAQTEAETGRGTFSAGNRQEDLALLRNFVYPKGYTDQQIVTLENGEIPDDLSVGEFARLHCGETNRFVLNPCIVRYADGSASAFLVVAQGANKSFADLKSAADYYRQQIAATAASLAMEIDVMNAFVDDFCTQVSAGTRPADIIAARGGDYPRINHPIATPDPLAKYQFSNLFSWERCKDCVGIVAVNQPEEAPPPTCGTLRKQGIPRIAYFVVDKTSSKGHRSLDDGLSAFTQLASPRGR